MMSADFGMDGQWNVTAEWSKRGLATLCALCIRANEQYINHH